MPAEVVAERAFTSHPTLRRIEAGDYSVSIGIYASVLQALGLLAGLSELASTSKDKLEMSLASEKLPQRVRMRRTQRDKGHEQ